MRGRIFGTAAAIALGWALQGAPAAAAFKLCNKTTENLSVAYGYIVEGDGWVAEGWRNLKIGQCSVLVRERRKASKYYFYAAGTNGGKWTSRDGQSGGYFCITRAKFRIPIKGYLQSGKLECDGSGQRSQQFREVRPKAANYSLTLTGGRASPAPTVGGGGGSGRGGQRSPKGPPPAGSACERYPNLC
jgi:uncharacterized membrane protein